MLVIIVFSGVCRGSGIMCPWPRGTASVQFHLLIVATELISLSLHYKVLAVLYELDICSIWLDKSLCGMLKIYQLIINFIDVNYNCIKVLVYFFVICFQWTTCIPHTFLLFLFTITQATQVDMRAAQVAQDEVSLF